MANVIQFRSSAVDGRLQVTTMRSTVLSETRSESHSAGFPEHNGYAVDLIEAVSEVKPRFHLHLLQLSLERCVILNVRNFVYGELTFCRENKTSGHCRCHFATVSCVARQTSAEGVERYEEGTAVLSEKISSLRQGCVLGVVCSVF